MRFDFQSLLLRPGARAAAGNLGWLVAERAVRLVLGVLVGFWVARYLGPAKFGLLGYALAVVGLGMAVAEAGVEGIVRRELLRDPAQGGAWLAAAGRLRLLVGGACYLCLVAWLVFRPAAPGEETLILLLVGIQLFQPALAVADLWLQANLQARLSASAQLGALALGSLGRLALIASHAPLWGFAAVASGEVLVAAFFISRLARAAGRPAATGPAPVAPSGLIAQSWPLLISGLTVMIYIRIDLVMVRHLAGDAVAGTYAAAVRLSEMGFFLPGALAASLLPGLLRARATSPAGYADALQRSFDLQAGIAYVCAVPVALLAPWLVRMAYGPDFAAAGPVLAVHAWTLLGAALGVARGQYCVNENLTRLHLLSTLGGAVLNVALNVVLIPRYGGLGAAWATLLAQVCAAWLSSFCFPRLRGVPGCRPARCASPSSGSVMSPPNPKSRGFFQSLGWRFLRFLSHWKWAREIARLTLDGYLQESGWLATMQQGRVVDAQGRPAPWYALPFVDFLAPRDPARMAGL